MFCPKCRAEYREGFYKCSDCDTELTDELPPESETRFEFVDFKEVTLTYNPADIASIKCILDSENISYFFKGEHFSYVRPLADPARLMVRKDQVNYVKEILKNLKLSFIGINLDKN